MQKGKLITMHHVEAPAGEPISYGSKLSILIVDDDKSNLDVLLHILKSTYTVYVAKTGEAAISRANKDLPDLILLDVMLPDMDGFAVLKKLHHDEKTSRIPVIFITGLDSYEDEARGFRLGAVDYIKKPFNNIVVEARINTHIKLISQMRTIERLGLIDPLLDIPNRRSFDNRIEEEWERARRENTTLNLIMIDIDHFKEYNDTHGHLQGDVMLQNVARVIQSNLRRKNDFVARFGGEEFMVILPNTPHQHAVDIAWRINSAVKAMQIPLIGEPDEDALTGTTISLGVCSLVPEIGEDCKSFIDFADKALYSAKSEGRDRVCVYKA